MKLILSPILSSGFLVLFAYSGMVKWLPIFPIDPTFLSALGLLAILLCRVHKGFVKCRGNIFLTLLSVLLFFAWYFFSSIYTVSPEYFKHKALVLLLNIFAFIFPVICFNTYQHFIQFNRFLLALSLITSLIILSIYIMFGSIDLILYMSRMERETSKIPDYLALGSVIGLGILSLQARMSFAKGCFAILGVATMFVLGSRGPILFTGILFFLGLFLHKTEGSRLKKIPLYSLITVVAVSILLQWQGAERSFQRFASIGSDTGARDGALRVSEFVTALKVISDSPLVGVGLGGYGIAGYQSDGNIYPHNIFLEAFAETGFIGFLLFGLSMLSLLLLAPRICKTKDGVTYLILLLFVLLNYQKSGGFISARNLYMFAGVYLSYLRLSTASPMQSEQKNNKVCYGS